jgi:cytochrome c oxidase assembly protein subunit 11
MIAPRLQGPKRTLVQLVSVVVVMASLSFAAVPFYDWFCRTTGFGGATGVAETGSDLILDRTIKVRFDASLEAGMPWEFRPTQTEMTVRIGETGLAFYEAYNPTNRPVAGTASYNVFPYSAGGYFIKIACFCFEEQVLQPGERVQMPVSFYVDPEMVKDAEATFVHEITLSYTFHQTPLPDTQAALQAKSVPAQSGALN